MTSVTKQTLPNGDVVEVWTNPGAAPLTYINGVLQYSHYRGPQGQWHQYFTWRPRKINGRWYWLTKIYRREKNKLVIPHQGWEYGDEFDILKDS